MVMMSAKNEKIDERHGRAAFLFLAGDFRNLKLKYAPERCFVSLLILSLCFNLENVLGA
jgi:hypothetical protein